MDGELTLGGLRCSEVLAVLDAWVEGELRPDDRARAEAHVAACTNCARFGGNYAQMVERLRHAAPAPAPEGLYRRVLGAMP